MIAVKIRRSSVTHYFRIQIHSHRVFPAVSVCIECPLQLMTRRRNTAQWIWTRFMNLFGSQTPIEQLVSVQNDGNVCAIECDEFFYLVSQSAILMKAIMRNMLSGHC